MDYNSGRGEKQTNIKKIVYAGVLVALGVILPQAFHVLGANAGMTFLPIHIPILLAGVMLGGTYGGVIGIVVPLASSLLTGMPPVPKLWFMLAELGVYGFAIGILVRKYNIYMALFLAMVLGRIAYALSLVVGVNLLGMSAPFMNSTSFIAGIVQGIPGMLIQIIVIPILYMRLKKGGFIFGKQARRSEKNITGKKSKLRYHET